ncbi:MAG: response regulator [Myxococcales bacterium]|nr:response regulator [Myxococcales bacterium]
MSRPRIIVVDDNVLLLRSLARRLGAFHVRLAECPERALALLDEEDADIIVSDYEMPRRDGVSLLSEIAQRHPKTRRVLMSSAPPDSAPHLVAHGVLHDVLEKPLCGFVDRLQQLCEAQP